MSRVSSSERVREGKAVTELDLESLARFRDDHGHAVSFYFRPGAGAGKERDGMLMSLRVRDIIS
ncbi:MAG TPA: hypothetical protein VFL42_14875, partial [Terriglobales bacterium]|nr:hypothetical protein [Terriglobales bacterium]